MALFGKFMKMGDKLGTDYSQNSAGMFELLDDFYRGEYSIAKSGGAAVYGNNGYFNAIMGKEIMAAMFSSDNTWTALGSKPYNHEGVRIATQYATYGVDKTTGKFVGIGATTSQDGKIADPVKMPVGEYREPFKDITFAFDYGLGLMALENKDDVSSYKDYVDKMTRNCTNLIDQTILRPVHIAQPKAVSEDDDVTMVETSLNSIWRCIANFDEVGKDEHGTTVLSDMVCPYGGDNGDFNVRVDRTTANKQKNFSGQLINLQNAVPTIADFRRLYRKCMVNWADSAAPNNKAWIMSNIAIEKLSALHLANNVQLDTVWVQKDFNGVKSYPGRDAGYMVNSYMNVPILPDGNINFDFDNACVSDVMYGDVGLFDLDHLCTRILTPMAMYNIDNPLINFKLQERNLLHMRCETYVDSFIGSGRIIGIMDDA